MKSNASMFLESWPEANQIVSLPAALFCELTQIAVFESYEKKDSQSLESVER